MIKMIRKILKKEKKTEILTIPERYLNTHTTGSVGNNIGPMSIPINSSEKSITNCSTLSPKKEEKNTTSLSNVSQMNSKGGRIGRPMGMTSSGTNLTDNGLLINSSFYKDTIGDDASFSNSNSCSNDSSYSADSSGGGCE